MADIPELKAADAWMEAEILAGFYSGHPAVSRIAGKKSSAQHLRLAFHNCIVTSAGTQRIFSDPDGTAFVHICPPGSWPNNLHEFILRGTMKIPFAIDSGTISRLAAYRDACLAISPSDGFSHVAAVCWKSGHRETALSLLQNVTVTLGGTFCAYAHDDSEWEFFAQAGFSPHGRADSNGFTITSMVREIRSSGRSEMH